MTVTGQTLETTQTVLVAGIGNIFLGDDGFGPAVAQRLSNDMSGPVRVVDYGIGGLHLAYDVLDGWQGLVLVDAVPNRGSPGSIEWCVPEPAADADPGLAGHSLHPQAVFAAVHALGGELPPMVLVGCQVASVAEGMGLSAPVAAAVPAAVQAVREAVQHLQGQGM